LSSAYFRAAICYKPGWQLQGMANSHQYQKESYSQNHQQAGTGGYSESHTQQYSGIYGFWQKLKAWFYPSGSDQDTSIAGHNCISTYQQLYEEASTDDRLEIIRNM
jgi:hypothetical protein